MIIIEKIMCADHKHVLIHYQENGKRYWRCRELFSWER